MSDQGIERLTIRLPRDVHSSLQAAADRGGRSLNREIQMRLAASVRQQPYDPAAAPDVVPLSELEGRTDISAVISEEVQRRVDAVLGEELDQRIRRILRDMINGSRRDTG